MDSKTGLTQKPATLPTPSEATTGSIEVPGVTQLLNRKSLGLAPAPPKKQPPLTPPPPPLASIPNPSTTPPAEADTEHTQIQAPPAEQISIQLDDSPLPGIEPTPSSRPEIHADPPLQTPTELASAEASNPPHTSSEGGISLSTGAPETLELEQNQTLSPPLEIAASPEPQKPTIKPQTRSKQNQTNSTPLILWTLEQLSQGTDPLGKGIKQLYAQGVQCALFLKVQTPKAGANFPHFTSTAAVTPENKLTLWEGLSWYPDVTPELWNQFIQAGFVELSPPNTQTVQTSHRNVVRAAFGVHRQEWLLMIRVGSVASCRGVLVVISSASLLPSLPASLPLFTADLPKAA